MWAAGIGFTHLGVILLKSNPYPGTHKFSTAPRLFVISYPLNVGSRVYGLYLIIRYGHERGKQIA